jgi:hypothetical protein
MATWRRGFSAISHQLFGIHRSVQQINTGLSSWRTGLVGVASVMGGSMILGGLAIMAALGPAGWIAGGIAALGIVVTNARAIWEWLFGVSKPKAATPGTFENDSPGGGAFVRAERRLCARLHEAFVPSARGAWCA